MSELTFTPMSEEEIAEAIAKSNQRGWFQTRLSEFIDSDMPAARIQSRKTIANTVSGFKRAAESMKVEVDVFADPVISEHVCLIRK